MTILIIEESTRKIAQALDDKSLSKMIKSVAQVLCNVQHVWLSVHGNRDLIPLKLKATEAWDDWCLLCIANYRYLVELGEALLYEYDFRFHKDDELIGIESLHKLTKIIIWCRENEPDLPLHADYHHKNLYTPIVITPFPLAMPKKYLIKVKGDSFKLKKEFVVNDIELHCCLDVIESYRNYYKHILEKRANKKCKECDAAGEKPITQTWTRRERPEWCCC